MKTLNTEKEETPNRIEKQNSGNRNISDQKSNINTRL